MKTTNRYRLELTLLAIVLTIMVGACGDDGPTKSTPEPTPPVIDRKPPADIADLSVESIVQGTAYLGWTAPGDDSTTGKADSYDLRYATDSLTLVNDWDSASVAPSLPLPKTSGSHETYQLEGLTEGVTYWVAIKTSDESGNISGLSNRPRVTSGPFEPTSVTDLRLVSIAHGTARLSWTASGNDGSVGTAESYDLRYATDSALLVNNWSLATVAPNLPTPKVAGGAETYDLSGLDPNVVYFAGLKVADDSTNVSGLSNVVRMTWSDSLGLAFPELQTADCSAIAVPLIVSRFSAVSGVQLYVAYEPANVTFDSMVSDAISDADVNSTSGTISVIWADMSQTTPVTLIDGDTLAMFYFSNLSGASSLSFQAQTKVVDTAAAYFTLGKTDGSMTCTGK